MGKHFRQDKPCWPLKNAFREALSRIFGYRQATDRNFEVSKSRLAITLCTDLRLSWQMDELLGTEMPLRSNVWTPTHSHYALMGGYAISNLSASSNILPNRQARLSLTPAALLFLAKHHPDLIPDLTEEEILDKSKASSLAKAIVCIQASWFCIQCILRLAEGLSISLLELNTFGHSICALIIYLSWWNKPLDIGLPSIISIKGHEGLFCAMIMGSSVGKRFDDISEIKAKSSIENSISLRKEDYTWFIFMIEPILGSTSRFRETVQNFIQVLQTLVTTRSSRMARNVWYVLCNHPTITQLAYRTKGSPVCV